MESSHSVIHAMSILKILIFLLGGGLAALWATS